MNYPLAQTLSVFYCYGICFDSNSIEKEIL
jgi:hypothetical protein